MVLKMDTTSKLWLAQCDRIKIIQLHRWSSIQSTQCLQRPAQSQHSGCQEQNNNFFSSAKFNTNFHPLMKGYIFLCHTFL